ncbi:outer membrane beta-barrel protein [Mariniphaga sp.]|uniref:outer membrane beta-barrel protein n=1 Tax=Mariniphaga sp. TaxID=1954475 RepID=UPI003562F7FF
MKQILIILFIALTTTAFGQTHIIGMQVGLNLTNISANEIFYNSEMRAGFTGGITYDLKLSDRYRIGVDVLYSQQGFSEKFSLVDEYGTYYGEVNSEMNFDYMSIPIKIGYEIGNKIKIIPKIGMVPAFPVTAESIIPKLNDSKLVIGQETVDQMDYISKFDFGGLIEIGIERALSEKLIICSALAYKHSLTTFSNIDYFGDHNLRHYGFSVSVGIKHGLSPKK